MRLFFLLDPLLLSDPPRRLHRSFLLRLLILSDRFVLFRLLYQLRRSVL